MSVSKRLQQYRHIEKSDINRDRSEERAREVATRTAISQRREPQNNNYDGLTADAAIPALEESSVKQLRDRASELSIKGRSAMRKWELIRAIREALH